MSEELDQELEERLAKTQEFRAPEEPAEPTWDDILANSKAKENDIKEGVRQSLESTLGGPVYVDSVKYIGPTEEGALQFEIRASVGKGLAAKSHTLIVQEPAKKFD